MRADNDHSTPFPLCYNANTMPFLPYFILAHLSHLQRPNGERLDRWLKIYGSA